MAIRLRLLFLGFLLAGPSCTPPKDSDWPEIKAWVAESFPEVPRVTVSELHRRLESGETPVLLDARAQGEFDVSHLPGAKWAEDETQALRALGGAPKNTPIVVYCSVGYRSGDLATQLITRGFTSVENLEGSIFEWANRGLPIEANGKPAAVVHPYDEDWGRLLEEERRAVLD